MAAGTRPPMAGTALSRPTTSRPIWQIADPVVPSTDRKYIKEVVEALANLTFAAVDRLVHHATIFELTVESYRRR